MSEKVTSEFVAQTGSLDSFPEQIHDYISNSTEDEDEKEIENQNRIMSNSVEKIIINPDTLSQYKSNDKNNKFQLPSDLINQLEELSQSLIDEDLDNSIVNNIEESEEKSRDNKQTNFIYQNIGKKKNESNLKYLLNPSRENLSSIYPKKKVNNNGDSLFKKVVNGLFLDNRKSKSSKSTNTTDLSLSTPEIKSKPTLGLSILYSLSNNGININNQNNLVNGLKSPLTPSLSSPDIENAVISSPITKQSNNQPRNNQPSLTSTSAFTFLPSSFMSIFSHESKSSENSSSLIHTKNGNDGNHIDSDSESEFSYSIPNQSIQNLREIKSVMDSKIYSSFEDSKNKKDNSVLNLNHGIKHSLISSPSLSSSSSKFEKGKGKGASNSKIDFQSFLNVFNNLSDTLTNNNDNNNNNNENYEGQLPPFSSTVSSSLSDNNKILPSDINKGGLSYPSYMTSLPLLSNGESFAVLPPLHHTDNNNKPKMFSSNEDGNNNNSNDNSHSVPVLPPTLLTEDKNDDEMSMTSSSLDSLSEYKSEKFLPSSEDKTELEPEPEPESKFNKDLNSASTTSSKLIPIQNKHISYNMNMNHSFLSQSFPKRNTYLTTNHHRHSSNPKNNINYLYPNRGVSASPDSSSLSSILENPENITLQEKVENSNNDSALRQSRIRFKTQSPLSSNNNKQNNLNQGNDNIRRRKTIYTSTSYFNKSNNRKNNSNNINININDQNNNKSKSNSNNMNNQNSNQIINKRKSNSNDANELRRAHSLHYSNRSSYGHRYSQSYGINNRHDSISSSRSAFTNFLSNFSFASSNSNTNTYSEQDEEEEDYDNEFADHSFIKSSASLYSSFINAEAEKKSSMDSKTPSVFDPDFIEKVRAKTIKHQKSTFLNSESYDKSYMGPSSFNSIIPEPEKLRLLNPVYIRAQYYESLRNHEDQESQFKSKPMTLSEMEQGVVSPDQILDTITAEKLRFHIPRRYRDYSTWELIFSLSEHGSSFITLYDKIVGKGPLLMVIKDSNDQVFGAYIPESVQISTRYYGTGECFLWKKGDGHDQRSFKVFEWSGLNELNVLTTRDMIAFGGGKQGHFGLCLDQYLEGGTTARCDTFRNEPLTISSKIDNVIKPQTVPTYYETPDISFECINIEFWKIVDNLR